MNNAWEPFNMYGWKAKHILYAVILGIIVIDYEGTIFRRNRSF